MHRISDDFAKYFAFLSLVIELSKGRELTGYAIIRHLREHGLEVSPGTVYSQLRRLKEEGLVEGRLVKHGDTFKTVYRATSKSEIVFKESKDQLRELVRYAYQNIQ